MNRPTAATFTLSYPVFYCTVYSMGLGLSEGLALKVGDIDGTRQRVHVRDSKGNRDRFVPSPDTNHPATHLGVNH